MQRAYRPNARRDGVLVEILDDELLLFDSERQCAHSLNACVARVWEACDGTRSVSELADECEEDESTVLLALQRLSDVHLLEPSGIEPPMPSETNGVSRRAMLRKSVVAGAGVGLAIPVIRSITAPSMAMASSGNGRNANNNKNCTSNGNCSPGSFCMAGGGGTQVCRRMTGHACSPSSLCSASAGNGTGHCPTGGSHPGRC